MSVERLEEIRDVLIEARKSTDYDIASPAAFDSLVTIVIALAGEMVIEAKLNRLNYTVDEDGERVA